MSVRIKQKLRELFRAIASSIDCPVPPVIADLVTESDALDAAESED